ncbi:transposable element Tcb2 transposase [Trichonephila clavipes]|nr:transposable element Tcb2 transposase [Trichonephila clavipes]
MNPIEHIWDALGRRVAGHQPPPQTLQELKKALLEEWDRIPQFEINSLIDSMSQRTEKRLYHPNEVDFLGLETKSLDTEFNQNFERLGAGNLTEAELVSKPEEISNVIEEVVDLSRQKNLQVDSDGAQELLDPHDQELTIDDLIEMHNHKSKTL